MQKIKPLLAKLLIPFLFLILLFTALPLLPVPSFLQSEEERFTAFTEEVFRNELCGNTLSMHYLIADPSAYALEDLPVKLGNASLKSRAQAVTVLENYQSVLDRFDMEKLSANAQLTCAVFRHYLKTELSGAPYLLYDEPLSPTLGVQAQLPILLAEYTFRTKRDIEDYLCLLTQVPDYFSSILAFERDKAKAGLFMSNACADEVIAQCRDFIQNPEENYLLTLFQEKIHAIQNLTADEKAAYQARNDSILNGYVIPAYESLISGLETLRGSGTNEMGLAYFPDGTAYYEYLVRSTVGDDRPISEIEEQIKTQIVSDFEAIRALSEGSTASESGNASDLKNTSESENTPDLETSSRMPDTAQAKRYLEELRSKITKDFPPAPDVAFQIRCVPDSLQEYLSPAFYLTPPLDDYQKNVIYLNPSADYRELELFTTLAHEGYPGHLYQTVYFHAQSPDLLRQLLDTGGYTEGWATYVELYACSLWEKDPVLAALYQHNRSFTLGIASLLDIGIHYHGYTPEQTAEFLEKLGFDRSLAASMYQTILEAPANYLKYYVGCLNFFSLREKAKTLWNEQFSLKEFHRFLLECGPAPFSILEEQLENAIVPAIPTIYFQ